MKNSMILTFQAVDSCRTGHDMFMHYHVIAGFASRPSKQYVSLLLFVSNSRRELWHRAEPMVACKRKFIDRTWKESFTNCSHHLKMWHELHME